MRSSRWACALRKSSKQASKQLPRAYSYDSEQAHVCRRQVTRSIGPHSYAPTDVHIVSTHSKSSRFLLRVLRLSVMFGTAVRDGISGPPACATEEPIDRTAVRGCEGRGGLEPTEHYIHYTSLCSASLRVYSLLLSFDYEPRPDTRQPHNVTVRGAEPISLLRHRRARDYSRQGHRRRCRRRRNHLGRRWCHPNQIMNRSRASGE